MVYIKKHEVNQLSITRPVSFQDYMSTQSYNTSMSDVVYIEV